MAFRGSSRICRGTVRTFTNVCPSYYPVTMTEYVAQPNSASLSISNKADSHRRSYCQSATMTTHLHHRPQTRAGSGETHMPSKLISAPIPSDADSARKMANPTPADRQPSSRRSAGAIVDPVDTRSCTHRRSPVNVDAGVTKSVSADSDYSGRF